MPTAVLVAIIAGVFSIISALISAFIAAYAATNKTSTEMRVNQGITNTKLDNLASDVKEFGAIAKRVPVLEEKFENLSNRLFALEKKVG